MVVDSPRCERMRRGDRRHHRRAGAVGRLDRARRKARMPDQRAVRVADQPGNRDAGRQRALRARRVADDAGRRLHGRQRLTGDSEQRQQLVIPIQRVQVEEQRARGVGHVAGVDAPAGQLEEQPAIDRAQTEFTCRGALPCAWRVVQQPAHLAGREHGVECQPGAAMNVFGDAWLLERLDQGVAALALPDDARRQRLARRPLPQHHRLALVGDAERHGRLRRRAEHFARALDDTLPDGRGILLHPCGARITDAQGRRGACLHLPCGVHQDCFRVRRALVDCENRQPGRCHHGPP